jgi:hypothetical protein
MRTVVTSVLLAAACLAGTAAAQPADPWNPSTARRGGGGGDEHLSAIERRDRAAVSADRFMIIRQNNDLLLVDGRTGCAWTRSDSIRADNGGSPWKHEFPVGARQQCYDVLIRLQQENR